MLPNSERFWRFIIVPLTRRINGYPNGFVQEINFRRGISRELVDIATAHYSMFINLVFAHIHLEHKMESSLEDIYVHLGSACDLVETIIQKWHLIFLRCNNMKSKLFQGLSRDKFLEKAGKKYDKDYPEWLEHYLSKGKNPQVYLIKSTEIMKEYLSITAQG
jgi:hypothetical protein